jgi:hypothetical protein
MEEDERNPLRESNKIWRKYSPSERDIAEQHPFNGGSEATKSDDQCAVPPYLIRPFLAAAAVFPNPILQEVNSSTPSKSLPEGRKKSVLHPVPWNRVHSP